jgi:hypothetical protein
MKFLSTLALLASLTTAVEAGVFYRFQTVSSGLSGSTMNGSVSVEGDRMRVDFEKGDGIVFSDHSFILGSTPSGSLTVVDPANRTFSDLSPDLASAGVGGVLGQLRDGLNMVVSKPRVSVHDFGPGDPLDGRPTRRHQVDTRFAVRIKTAAGELAVFFHSVAENWTTDALPASYATFLAGQSVRTGVAEVDKVIAESTKTVRGFPLKQIVTTTIVQNGSAVEFSTVTTVTDIEKKIFAPAIFSLPAGYSRTENPVARAMKALEH